MILIFKTDEHSPSSYSILYTGDSSFDETHEIKIISDARGLDRGGGDPLLSYEYIYIYTYQNN